MPILITGLFEPSDGAHGFDLLNDTDLGFVDPRAVNTVLAGPSSGGSAAATFRLLTAADIPGLSGTYQPLDADLTALAALAATGGMLARTGAGAFAVRTIAVGSSKLTMSNGDGVAGAPTIDLAIPVVVASGGTGLTVGTSGGIPYFNATTTMLSSAALTASALLLGGGAGASPTAMASLGTTTTILHGNAAGAPTFAAVSLTADVSGVLPVANGGTNIASYAVGDLLYASGATTLSKLADVAVGAYLRSGGVTTAPLWSTTTLPNSATTGALLHASATNVYTNLDDIATGNVLLSGGVGVVPSYGKVGLTTHVSGVLPIANGGSNKALTLVNGGILWTDADSFEVSAAGTLGQLLRSAGAAAPTWTTATFPATAGTSGNVLTSDGTNWSSAAPAGGGSVANPTALVGLTPVNGVATSAIRSDGAPALDVTIAPTWTGQHTFDNSLGGVAPIIAIDPGGDPNWLQINDTNTGFNMKLQVFGGGISANRIITLNDADGALLTSSGTANVSGKTFTTSNSATCDAVGGTGWYFRQVGSTTKRLYLNLIGLTALNHSLVFNATGTVAKVWTMEDMSGSLVAAGNGSGRSVVCTTAVSTAVTSAALFNLAADPVLVGQLMTGTGMTDYTWVTVKTDASNLTINRNASVSSVARTFSPQVDAAAKINMTGLVSNIGTSAIPLLLTNATPAGFYRISAVMTCTTGAAGANVNLWVKWTGDSAAADRQLGTLVMTTTGQITNVTSYTAYLASGNFTFYTDGWTAGTYALRIRMEFLGA